MTIGDLICENKIASEVRDLWNVDTLKRILLGGFVGYSITLMAGSSVPLLGIDSELARVLGFAGLGTGMIALARLGSCESTGSCSTEGDCS